MTRRRMSGDLPPLAGIDLRCRCSGGSWSRPRMRTVTPSSSADRTKAVQPLSPLLRSLGMYGSQTFITCVPSGSLSAGAAAGIDLRRSPRADRPPPRADRPPPACPCHDDCPPAPDPDCPPAPDQDCPPAPDQDCPCHDCHPPPDQDCPCHGCPDDCDIAARARAAASGRYGCCGCSGRRRHRCRRRCQSQLSLLQSS